MPSPHAITARALIWIAALATPVQSLPAGSCGCDSGMICSSEEQFTRCCSSANAARSNSCCSARRNLSSAYSCCSKAKGSKNSSCQCGVNCKCGKTKQSKPATPPIETIDVEKVVNESLTATTQIANSPITTQRLVRSFAPVDANAALDRCVSFCRFTL